MCDEIRIIDDWEEHEVLERLLKYESKRDSKVVELEEMDVLLGILRLEAVKRGWHYSNEKQTWVKNK